jgi:hypothetical protein
LKTFLQHITVALLLACQALPAVAAHSNPVGLLAVRNDTRQQQDPKPPKVITAKVTRSIENELITVLATFPEDMPGVKVSMFNILGKLIDLQAYGATSQGESTYQFLTKGLPNGPYLIVLEAGNQRITNKVMLSR